MKLAAKLVIVLILMMIAVQSINGYLRARRELEFFNATMRADATFFGTTLGKLLSDVWLSSGRARALEMIEDMNRTEHRIYIRWVWLEGTVTDTFRPRVALKELAPVLQGQRMFFEEQGRDGRGHLYIYIPVDVGGERRGALELDENLSHYHAYVHDTVKRTVILTGVLVSLSGILALMIGVTMIGRPLRRLMEKARRVGEGDLSGPIHFAGKDELAELAETLNTTCERLEAAQEQVRAETAARIASLEQLRHADRLSTVGRLASGVAHELGTPLNVVSGRAGMIAAGDLSAAEVTECANIIRAQVDRITAIVRQLLDFARRRPTKKSPTDMAGLVTGTLKLLSTIGGKQNVSLEYTGEERAVRARVDAGQIQQVLMNIILNAVQAMPGGGAVRVDMRSTVARPPEGHEGAEGRYLRISVRDEGAGISPEHLPHIFEPFFTTKDVGKGSGLGLSIAYGIVREHGGWIDVQSEVGVGSCFDVYLPLEDEQCPDGS